MMFSRLKKINSLNLSRTYLHLTKPLNSEKTTIVSREEESRQKSELAEKKDVKPVKNEPFIKSLFNGKYVFDYLKFPEYIRTAEVENLNANFVDPLRGYLSSTSRNKILSGTSYTPEALEKFKQLGLFALSLPGEHHGLDLDATSVARLVEECGFNGHADLAVNLIYANEIAGKLLRVYGNSKQQEKYLKRVSKGELRLGLGYSELHSGIDSSLFELTATRTPNDNSFVLNGEKCWVSLFTSSAENQSDAALILVAKTIDINNQVSLTAFIVDANTPGVNLRKQESIDLYSVDLRNVKLTEENVLGQVGSGYEIAMRTMDEARYLVGAACTGLLKRLFKQSVDYCIDTKRFGKSLSDHLGVKSRVASVETRIYAMESMVYMTAGILDSYQIADVGCESALTKVFCTEALRLGVDECLDLVGMSAYESGRGDEFVEVMRSGIVNRLLNTLTNNEVLRMQVATSSVILAGIELGDEVVKSRNPLMFPSFIFKQFLNNRKLMNSVKKDLPEYFFLWEHLHPSLNDQASLLEQCAVRLMLGVKGSLVNHGREIVDYQISLRNLGEMALHIYAMNAALARASRSYSIGLENSNHELSLAHFLVKESSKKVYSIYEDMAEASRGQSLDNTRINVANTIFKKKGHSIVHSLTRNY